jgi:type II secretion system protein N
MTGIKKTIAVSFGYAAFFSSALLLFLFITFDPTIAAPMIEAAAEEQKINIKIDKINLKGLKNIELRGLSIAEIPPSSVAPPTPLKIDRLYLSPSISSIFSIISHARKGEKGVPPVSLTFEAAIGEGRIENGKIETGPLGINFSADIQDLPLDRIPVQHTSLENFTLFGKMNARIDLKMGNQNEPNTWDGEIQADIIAPKTSDFKAMHFDVAAIKMQSGTLRAKIEKGDMKISTLKLTGDDIPINIEGNIILNKDILRSKASLKGSIKMGDDYLEKMPLIKGFAPNTDNYTFNGQLQNIFAIPAGF